MAEVDVLEEWLDWIRERREKMEGASEIRVELQRKERELKRRRYDNQEPG